MTRVCHRPNLKAILTCSMQMTTRMANPHCDATDQYQDKTPQGNESLLRLPDSAHSNTLRKRLDSALDHDDFMNSNVILESERHPLSESCHEVWYGA
ncbi:hypothetical protein IG631_12789 [Alternaria alternata]|nr:hypothetical protein IG631_12789 [Alternaria alternata]